MSAELKALLEAVKAENIEIKAKAAETAARLATAEAGAKALGEMVEKLAAVEPPKPAEAVMHPLLKHTVGDDAFVEGAKSGNASAKMDASILPMGAPGRKAWPEGIGITTGSGIATTRAAEFPSTRPLVGTRLRDILNVVAIRETAVDYMRASFSHLAAIITVAVAAVDTTITVDNAHGFFAGQDIVIGDGVGALKAKVSSVNKTTGVITLAAAAGQIVALGTIVTSQRFVFTPETKLKPRAKAAFEQKSVQTKTLAHWLPITNQAASDVPQLQAFIETNLLEGLVLAEERQILKGNGTTDQLEGLFSVTDIPTVKWEDGLPTDTKVDTVRRAIQLVIDGSRLGADALILNPFDAVDIDLQKKSDGSYLFGGPTVQGGISRLWGVPVVISNELAAGEAMVGNFRLGCTLYDREQSNIRISEHHEDFFVRNCFAIRAEERVAFAVQIPEAFVKIDLSTAPPQPDPEPETPPQQGG